MFLLQSILEDDGKGGGNTPQKEEALHWIPENKAQSPFARARSMESFLHDGLKRGTPKLHSS